MGKTNLQLALIESNADQLRQKWIEELNTRAFLYSIFDKEDDFKWQEKIQEAINGMMDSDDPGTRRIGQLAEIGWAKVLVEWAKQPVMTGHDQTEEP